MLLVLSSDAVRSCNTDPVDAVEMDVILGAGRLKPRLVLAVEMAWVSCTVLKL